MGSNLRKSEERSGLLFVLPQIIGLVLFILLPFMIALYLCFCEWDFISSPEWVGLANFKAVFGFDGDIFAKTLENTGVFLLGVIPLTMFLALGLALLANQHLPFLEFYKSALFIVIKPSQYYTDAEHGTPAFRSANVRENHIDDFDWVYLNDIGMENNKRSIVHTGDVLVVRSGNPGTACVVSEKFDGYNAIDILIAVPNQNLITPEFLCCYTNSPFGKNLVSENKRVMALAHFNVKGYSGLPIRIPTLGEQTEIVRILDSLFAKEQQAKEAAEAVLEKIDLLKKSILARAFRGELGTNDPTEESAVEFLKNNM